MTTILLALLFLQDLPHAFPRENVRQIVDNERVTIWDVTLPKGKPTSMHRHQFDMVVVDLADATAKVTSPEGVTSSSSTQAGRAYFFARGMTHIEEGVSDTARHAIAIDLKDVKVPVLENKSGHPPAFPRTGAMKLIENDRVVVWDYRWTPGVATPMHFHDKDVVAIFLDNGELASTTPDRVAESVPLAYGQARFNPRGRAHTETLVKGAARAILVELK